MLCTAAVTVWPKILTPMMASIIQPCDAAPHSAYASMLDTRPQTARRCGANFLSNGPSMKPCTITCITPTAASDQPFCSGPQPNLKVV